MRIHFHWLDLQTGEITSLSTRRRYITFGLENEQLQHHKSNYSVHLQFDGANLLVTDRGSRERITLAKQELAVDKPRVWLPHQELQIGDRYLLTWEQPERQRAPAASKNKNLLPAPRISGKQIGTLSRLRALPQYLLTLLRLRITTPLEGVSPRFAALLLAFFFATVTWLLWNWVVLPTNAIVSNLPTPTTTARPTATATAMTVTAVLATGLPVPPTVTVVRATNMLDFVPTATDRALAIETAAALATPIPCAESTLKPVEWDVELDELNVKFSPACTRPGEPYWRLVEAHWQDEKRSNGYHHVFVDIIDAEGNRLHGENFTMSWPTGECKRSIRGISQPFGHGEHCPMFAPGAAYEVKALGLPSDVVRGLGLGSIENREHKILTSFHLIFQRTLYPSKKSP